MTNELPSQGPVRSRVHESASGPGSGSTGTRGEAGPKADPIAAALNERRKEWGMPIAEWARRSGVGEATIHHLLQGRSGGSFFTIYALAAVFDMEVYVRPREH